MDRETPLHRIAEADTHMVQRQFESALTDYGDLLMDFFFEDRPGHEAAQTALTTTDAFWVAMAFVEAAMMLDDFKLARIWLERSMGLGHAGAPVVGNPYFHLMAAEAKWDGEPITETGPGTVQDELARVLIGGGVELLDGTFTELRDGILAVLRPPEGFDSWEVTRGTEPPMADMLDTAIAWPRRRLEKAYGRFPLSLPG